MSTRDVCNHCCNKHLENCNNFFTSCFDDTCSFLIFNSFFGAFLFAISIVTLPAGIILVQVSSEDRNFIYWTGIGFLSCSALCVATGFLIFIVYIAVTIAKRNRQNYLNDTIGREHLESSEVPGIAISMDDEIAKGNY